MYSRKILKPISFLMVLLLLVLIVTLQVSAESYTQAKRVDALQQSEDLTVTKRSTRAQADAALAFWTREQLARALPMEMPVDAGAAVVEAFDVDDAIALGAPNSAPPGKPASGADRIAQQAYPQDWKNATDSSAFAMEVGVAGELAGSSQVYTSYIVNQWSPAQKIYPHKWIGRLSFTTPSGTSYCSATAISKNNIVTAAHCVYDTTNNRWYSNFVFTPAYRDGNAPYGTFAWSACTVLNAWINLSGSYSVNNWARHDVAVCTMRNNSAGQSLNYAVGWAGREWNYPYVRHFFDLGYPFRNTNDALLTDAGKYLRTCVAESFQQTTDTRGMGCNLSRGISGGPWLIGYAPPNVSGWVDGVNSGFFIGTANMYGARFDSNNIVPLCNTRGC